jgi:ADP-dependent NAD(P)H-hydrate dehydratase / NAD(P)H-hydrate epimerase
VKILSAQQIREADSFTINNEPISSTELMERAATACFHELQKIIDKNRTLYFFCGTGNNGGDGLVMAKLAEDAGYEFEVWLADFSENSSSDFLFYKQKLEQRGIPISSLNHNTYPEIKAGSVIIDAIFGTGINRPVEGAFADLIEFINKQKLRNIRVVSVDMPSGLFDEDNSSNAASGIVQADITLTFQVPKFSFMLAENARFIGEFKVLDIGLNQHFIEKINTPYQFIDLKLIRSFYQKRNKFSHKGNFGHALLLAGSEGKMGAAVLASKACLRSGAGLLTTHIPKCGYNTLQTTVPEAMASVDRDEKMVSELIKTERFAVAGAGPGLGIEKDTEKVIKRLIQDFKGQLIFDADALNMISENKTWLSFIPVETILTPHPGEFDRLAGSSESGFERLKKAREFAKKYKVILILKGAHTAVCAPDGSVYFNSTGNAGMATGGSGDVLTGIITGLCSRGYSALEASVLGVFVHGLAGDFAEMNLGQESLLAGDIINHLPEAFLEIEQVQEK